MEKDGRIDQLESDGAPSPSDEEKNSPPIAKAPLDVEDPDEGKSEEERAEIVRVTAECFKTPR